MADFNTAISIIFNAIDHTGDGLSSVAKGVKETAESASKVTEPLAEIAKKSLEAEAAVLALGTAFLTVASNEADRFQNKVEEIGSLVNAAPEDVDRYKVKIREFAEESTSSFESIEKAVYIATSNFGNFSAAMDVMATAQRGAVVGVTDIEVTTSLLTRTMNAYGAVTNDAATNTRTADRYMAAMFTTVQNGDINILALRDNLGQVSSTAAAANVPIETLGAAVAALTAAGVNPAQSMTLLNSLLKELLNPSKELSEALGGLSVTTNGLPAVMDKLKESTGGSAEKVYALFSSSEAAKAGLILANDSAGKFDGTIKAMDGNIDAFNKNYANMVGGVDDSTQKLANSTRILLQKVGDPLQEGWADILDGLSAIMKGFSLSIDKGSFNPVFAAFNEFGGDISALLNQIGKNLPEALAHVDFNELIAALKDAGFEIKDLFGNIDLSTPEGLAHAIQFVVDTFESLTRVVSGIIDAWGPVVRGFIDGIDTFNELDDSSKKTVGNMLGLSQIFETLKGVLTTGVDALDIIGKALTAIAGIQAGTGVASLVSALGGAGLATQAAGLVAVGAAIYGTYKAVDANIDAWKEYKARQDLVAESTSHLTETQAKIKGRLSEISERTGVVVTSMDELNKAVDEGRLVFNEITGVYDKADDGIISYNKSLHDTGDQLTHGKDGLIYFKSELESTAGQTEKLHAGQRKVNDELGKLGLSFDYVHGKFIDIKESGGKVVDEFGNIVNASGRTEQEIEKLASRFTGLKGTVSDLDSQLHSNNAVFDAHGKYLREFGDESGKAGEATKKLGDAVKNTADANVKGTEAWKRAQEVMLQTQKQMDDFSIKMEELTLHKYEIDVKANVDLQTAQIEADTARIAAAFASASDVIGSLNTSVTDLWKLFANKDTWDGARSDIKDAAMRQEERLNTELQLKEKLTNAVVDQARATTQRLSSGAPLISIDGGNLAPELEAIFDKILKFTQIKATQQGLSMLVGL